MTEPLGQYACDTCRVRKIGCSRHRSGCQRCKDDGNTCSYTRSGVIRRTRKKEKHRRIISQSEFSAGAHDTVRSNSRGLPQPSSDHVNGTTHERLQRLVGGNHKSLGAIASLLEEYAAVWQGSCAFDKLSEGAEASFLRFEEDQVRVWVDAFAVTLAKERLPLTSAPREELEHLVASRPGNVRDRAWLVMFYSVTLGGLTSTSPSDEATKARLKSNLWLAFNDVRLLLEPQVSSIQALIILACHVEESLTPSMCWSLVSRACTMLQGLGITHWRLDSPTRERRIMLFWRLNVMDNALALIMCKPPTFCREMTATIPSPTLDQLLPSQSHYPSSGAPALFDAHYMNQMHLLSCIMADVWHCLYGPNPGDGHSVKESLESWHRQATAVLEAAALAEKPLLTASGAASVDLCLRTLRFHYYSLLVLLMVSCGQLRTQSSHPARQMLSLLPILDVADVNIKAPYTCLLWQRLHCPLVAFGALWGEIVTKRKTHIEQSKQNLAVIEYLPVYFGKLRLQHSLAAELENITRRIIQHARSILHSQDEVDPKAADSSITTQGSLDLQQSTDEDLGQHPTPPMTACPPPIEGVNASKGHDLDNQPDGLFAWPDDFFFDATFDWFSPSKQGLF